MSVVCQNVATLTTTTVVTTSTVYVTTSLSQGVGLPTTSTLLVPSSTCSQAVSGNVTSEACVTMTMMSTQVIPGSPTQIQVPVTVTSQILQTQINTLFGSVCNTVPIPPTTPPTTPPVTPPTTPPPQSTPPPPPAALTTTTYSTHLVTVTGPAPTDTTTPYTPSSSTSAFLQSTVYGITSSDSLASDASGTAIGAVASPTSSSSVSAGAIAGIAIGGVVLIGIVGLVAYFFIIKKSVFSPKGYERPVGEDINDQFADSDGANGQSGLYPQMQEHGYQASGILNPQPALYPEVQGQGGYPLHGSVNPQSGLYPHMQDQGGYHAFHDGAAHGQQLQGSSGPHALQNSGQLQPQDFNGQNLYADSQAQGAVAQVWQQSAASGAVVNGTSVSAMAGLPPGAAAAAVVVGHSPHSSTSSSGSPGSISTVPLISPASRHRQQHSQGSVIVPYRGYAEPVNDPF